MMDVEDEASRLVWVRARIAAAGGEVGPLEDQSGWANRVYTSPTHVVRISSGRFRDSFSHDRSVISLLMGQLPVPVVVDAGEVVGRQWMIMERLEGQSLLRAWPAMQVAERRRAITSLGETLAALHRVQAQPGFTNPWIEDAMAESNGAHMYLTPPQSWHLGIEAMRSRKLLDTALVDRISDYLSERISLFAEDKPCLIHGDIHFNNLIWDGEKITLLDFEIATLAAADREVQALNDFIRDPAEVFGPEDDLEISGLSQVQGWLGAAYPGLFASPDFIERQDFYAMQRNLCKVYRYPTGEAQSIVADIEALLDGEHVFTGSTYDEAT